MLNQLLEQIKDFAWKWVPKVYYVHVNTINAHMNLRNPETRYMLTIDVSRMNNLPFKLQFEYNSYEEMEADLPSVFMRVVEALEPTILLSENCSAYITEKIHDKMNFGVAVCATMIEDRFSRFVRKVSDMYFLCYHVQTVPQLYYDDLDSLWKMKKKRRVVLFNTNELIQSPLQRHGMQMQYDERYNSANSILRHMSNKEKFRGIDGSMHFGGSEPAPELQFQVRCPICHYPTDGKGHRCILTTEQL